MHCTYISSSFLFHSSSLPLEPSHASLSICSFHSQASLWSHFLSFLMIPIHVLFISSVHVANILFHCHCTPNHLFIHLTLNHLNSYVNNHSFLITSTLYHLWDPVFVYTGFPSVHYCYLSCTNHTLCCKV